MKYNTREDRGAFIVSFEGDVDLESSRVARKALLEAVGKGAPVVVDLSQVGYMDSSGIASMVEALQASKKAKQSFALANVSESADRVIRLARLDRVFTIHATLEDGINAVS
jgi:anti-sigma B factor antagonist